MKKKNNHIIDTNDTEKGSSNESDFHVSNESISGWNILGSNSLSSMNILNEVSEVATMHLNESISGWNILGSNSLSSMSILNEVSEVATMHLNESTSGWNILGSNSLSSMSILNEVSETETLPLNAQDLFLTDNKFNLVNNITVDSYTIFNNSIKSLVSVFQQTTKDLLNSTEFYSNGLVGNSTEDLIGLASYSEFIINEKVVVVKNHYEKLLELLDLHSHYFNDYEYFYHRVLKDKVKNLFEFVNKSRRNFEKLRISKIRPLLKLGSNTDSRKSFRSIIGFYFKNLDDESHLGLIKIDERHIKTRILISRINEKQKIKNSIRAAA